MLSGYVEYVNNSLIEVFLSSIVPVYIDISSNGATRTISTFTRRDGSFSLTFYPALMEYGTYVAGARHPGYPEALPQTGWSFLGLKSTPNTIFLNGEAINMFEETFYNVTVVSNDGPAPLSGLIATPILTNSRYISVEILLQGIPSNDTLEPGDKVAMDIRLSVLRPLNGFFPIVLNTTQGTALQLYVNFQIEPILPSF